MAQHIKLDDVDYRLIDLLRKDGRATNRDLAQALDLAEPTVRARIRRLADAKVMRVVALTDFAALGYDLFIMTWIRVEGRPVAEVAAELASLHRVLAVSVIAGGYDIFAIIVARDKRDLSAFTSNHLSKVRGIRDLDGVLALEILLYNSEWGPPIPPIDEIGHHINVNDKIDQVDWQIIEILRHDGRLSNREVARQIGVSEGTVRARLRRLEESQTMKVMAVANPLALGKQAWAPVGLHVERGRMQEVAEALRRLDNLTLIAVTFGMFDLVAVVLVDTRDQLLSVLSEEIARIPGVLRTDTTEALRVVKYNYTLAKIA